MTKDFGQTEKVVDVEHWGGKDDADQWTVVYYWVDVVLDEEDKGMSGRHYH